MKDNSKYQNCPVCESLCEIAGGDSEGAYRYVPLGDNAKVFFLCYALFVAVLTLLLFFILLMHI